MNCIYNIIQISSGSNTTSTGSFHFQLDGTGSVQMMISGSFEGNWIPTMTSFLQQMEPLTQSLIDAEITQIQLDVQNQTDGMVNNRMDIP